MKYAAIFLFALLSTGGLHASESLEIEYYDVRGSNAQELREAMHRHGPTGEPAELEREWERYSAALRAHEDGHADLGAAAAGKIQRRLSEMSGTSGCQALVDEMNRTGRALIEEAKARELEYDATTDHAVTGELTREAQHPYPVDFETSAP